MLVAGRLSIALSINHVDMASVQSAVDERSLNMDSTSAIYSIRSSVYFVMDACVVSLC